MTQTSDIVITIADVREHGFCGKGVRGWLTQNGLDYETLLSSGYTVGQLSGIDDYYLTRIIDAKILESNNV